MMWTTAALIACLEECGQQVKTSNNENQEQSETQNDLATTGGYQAPIEMSGDGDQQTSANYNRQTEKWRKPAKMKTAWRMAWRNGIKGDKYRPSKGK